MRNKLCSILCLLVMLLVIGFGPESALVTDRCYAEAQMEETLSLQSFSDIYLEGSTRETEKGVLLSIESSFDPGYPVQYAWYVYSSDSLDEPVYKTGYSEGESFSVELPANETGYRAFVYVRDAATKERVKAEVGFWAHGELPEVYPVVSEFARQYVTVEQTDERTWCLTNDFIGGPRVQIAWSVYDVNDLNAKIDGTGYSYEPTFEYTVPDENKCYAVKAFVCNKVTQEKRSVWAAVLPQHPCAGFSSACLAGKISETEDGVMITVDSLFETNVPVQYAWYVYSSDDLNEPVYKTSYSEEKSFSAELPANETDYRVFVYIRDTITEERVKAEVGHWQHEAFLDDYSGVSEFTRLNVSVEQTGERTYCLTSDFNGGPQVQIAWAVYSAEDKNTKLDGAGYSYNSTFEYTLPDEGRYAVKAFVRDLVTEEQKSAWVAYLPQEQLPEPQPDPIPGFTYRSIERTILEEGYSFRNTFDEAEIDECGFYVYARNGSELQLLNTVQGDTLRFLQEDPDQDYVLKAYIHLKNGAEKTVEFYRLYGITTQNCIAGDTLGGAITIDELMAGTFNGESVEPPVNWLLPGIANRNIRNYWNTFHAEYALIQEYINTGDQKYAYRFIEYMQDFLDQYPDVPVEEDSEIWTDSSLSFRVRCFSVARMMFDHMISNELLAKMEDHLAQCADILASELYYKAKHNHGMYQDIGLLYYLDAFGYTDQMESYRRGLAKQRLEAYLSYSVTDSGCHKEHSPAYHYDVMRDFGGVGEYFERFGDAEAKKYYDINEKMKAFYFDLVMPDYTWPPLGDSYATVRKKEDPQEELQEEPQEELQEDPRYKWVMSQGTEGEPPADCFAVYEDGGYVIMRSSWQDAPDEGTYAILTAATHSTAHKHQDDLNFILYHKGQLFTEAGKRNYNYDEPATIYAYSSFAHNVLFVNRQGWPMSATNHPVLDDAAYETHITGYGNEDGAMWASARSVRWPQVTQDRTLSYDRNLDKASVCDILTAAEETDIRLIYHIAEGVDIEQTDNGWILSRNGMPVADVQVEASGQAMLSTLRGQEEDGDFKTWLFDSEHIEEPMYGGLLIVDMVCEPGENQVNLQIDLK